MAPLRSGVAVAPPRCCGVIPAGAAAIFVEAGSADAVREAVAAAAGRPVVAVGGSELLRAGADVVLSPVGCSQAGSVPIVPATADPAAAAAAANGNRGGSVCIDARCAGAKDGVRRARVLYRSVAPDAELRLFLILHRDSTPGDVLEATRMGAAVVLLPGTKPGFKPDDYVLAARAGARRLSGSAEGRAATEPRFTVDRTRSRNLLGGRGLLSAGRPSVFEEGRAATAPSAESRFVVDRTRSRDLLGERGLLSARRA
eukprot:TRINITY_DN5074_c0_g1_i10.p2 TRINITY_DN5074_c0_g1~~TRINITY_DN5074_c0_g1_i10.p2  ORF type:complete len:257 (+),score=57.94 TRINITY_DN5074_c0_g1_i10:64-834(+)